MNLKKDKKGFSIAEVLIAVAIISMGLVGAFSILGTGQNLGVFTENRIKGVNIAREGLEAVENIRDTNWLKFSSDYVNCWNIKNYDVNCIGSASPSVIQAGSYILYNSGNKWYLSGTIIPDSSYSVYTQQFPVYFDSGGLISQTENITTQCSKSVTKNCKSIFTREIQIAYPDTNTMKVNSVVTWKDETKKNGEYRLNFELKLKNWKKNL